MKESIIGFINDTANLNDIDKAKRLDDYVLMQLENFILHNWSDDKEREREIKSVTEWWNEIEEEEDGVAICDCKEDHGVQKKHGVVFCNNCYERVEEVK